MLTPAEVLALNEFALRSLQPGQIQALHRRYVADLAAAAWEDGVVTREETNEICMAANLLGIPHGEVARMLESAGN